jgi:integrase
MTGRYVDPGAGRVTLATFAQRWLDAQTFDPSTSEGVERRLRVHILPVLGDVELRNLRPSSIQAWLRSRDGSAPSSVRVMLVNLSAILSAAVEDGLIATNPCASSAVRAPAVQKRRVVPWTSEQVQAVVEAHSVRYRAVPVVAAGLGLRQGETFGLRVKDVDFLRQRVLVRRQVKIIDGKRILAPPKSRKEREVPLPEVVAVAISERLRKHPAADGLVFTSDNAELLHRTRYNNSIWKPALRVAGVEPTRENGMHALRHHYASVLLEGGVSIRALADYLGHSDPGFTLRVYAHLMPDSEDRTRSVVDASFGVRAEPSRHEDSANS